MIRSGALPNSRTYTVLIDHLLRSRHLDAASQIFYLLPSMRARRTSKQYDVLAAALAEAGRFDDLRALIREFRCDGILPGRPMLAAVKAMREAGFVEGTDEFVKELLPDSRIRYTVTLGEEEEQNEEEEEDDADDDDDEEEKAEEDGAAAAGKFRLQVRPCELYACNLPRSTDISQLLDLFNRYGTVISVEVSRDAVTGISRGCGFVTMSSLAEAKAAISALDGSDLGGREMCVKFSADMVSGRKNTEALNTTPKKDIVFESPYKVYVGNLAWSVRPEGLREHFSQFGTVVSTRVLYDRKGGKNRVYGFLSFSSADEQKAAIESNGSVFHGRTMLVREVVNREEA
ncbi:33 kDa ribonucleoprotein, chloroplastic-like [Ananas comosus]|uniref:33 kDa ribonucleoprotein, chloroplastic-like n=1 Tax=Ananas comosus TaxID=4615 RepID=A0A6P5FGC9_ANACO|nr:33 kDa ribonucleoprotein, chloroplastic-like [Ananas comosus]XP_020092512.1 33 kDa ribonucleoprotein, chloroplastic-like [Ananas comosus]XP_020092513.1 33 kDa ribonucleoprotein, chloroplastic-like [Ananas comosus]